LPGQRSLGLADYARDKLVTKV